MRLRTGILLLGLLPACSGNEEGASSDGYDADTLAAYLSAIPEQERLLAAVPALDEPGALSIAGDAVLGAHGVEFARSVNRPVRALVATLRAITSLPPTQFDAAGRKFVWGPWKHERGVGQVALVIAQNPAGADFRYGYLLLRSTDGSLEGATPVISGGSTPDADEPERGVGVALWDVDADRQFELDHGSADGAERGRGRFVTLFGHEAAEQGDSYFNLAVFRNFVPEEALREDAAAEPLDVDYFYGRFDGEGGMRLDFVDSDVRANLCGTDVESCFAGAPPASPGAERFEYNAFFVNRGAGRAEARLSEGDLDRSARFVECWNPGLRRSSFQVEGTGVNAGMMMETLENGGCAAPADQSAVEIGIPTLDDIDPALLGVMSCAAENGLIGCEQQ
jgi:hypothetical protein